MSDLTFNLLILLAAGVLAGFLAGLFGIGGGLVFIPVLFFLYIAQGMDEGAAISLAVGTSLATIIFSSSSSAYAHFRLQNIDFNVLKRWIPPLCLGVVLASFFVNPKFGKVLVVVFVCLLVLVALNFYFNIGGKLSRSLAHSLKIQFVISFFIGAFSVMAGVGGGALSVPALVASGLSAHRAIGTSATIGLFISIPAVTTLVLTSNTPVNAPAVTVGLINYSAMLVLALTSIFFAPLGAKFGKRLREETLKRLFASCLLLVAISMLYRAF